MKILEEAADELRDLADRLITAGGTVEPTASTRSSSREGKRAITIYLSQEVYKQLQLVSVDLDVTIQALGEEAINLLLEKRNKSDRMTE